MNWKTFGRIHIVLFPIMLGLNIIQWRVRDEAESKLTQHMRKFHEPVGDGYNWKICWTEDENGKFVISLFFIALCYWGKAIWDMERHIDQQELLLKSIEEQHRLLNEVK